MPSRISCAALAPFNAFYHSVSVNKYSGSLYSFNHILQTHRTFCCYIFQYNEGNGLKFEIKRSVTTSNLILGSMI